MHRSSLHRPRRPAPPGAGAARATGLLLLRHVAAGTLALLLAGISQAGLLPCHGVVHLDDDVPGGGKLFARALAMDGNTLVVAAPDDAVGSPDAGAVHVYVFDGTSWNREALIGRPATMNSEWFGWAVAVSGDTLAVGTWTEDSGGLLNSGVVHVYERNGSSWTLQAELTSPEPLATAAFGSALALDGDVLVASDRRARIISPYHGAVFVFRRTGTTWTPEASLHPVGIQASENPTLGEHLDIEGDRIVASMESWPFGGSVGKVVVFERQAFAWYHVAMLTNADGNTDDGFGDSFSLSGDLIAVGAASIQGNCCDGPPGVVHVFRHVGIDWQREAILPRPDLPDDKYFGQAVAVRGERIVATAAGNALDTSSPVGSAYLFEHAGSGWRVQARLLSPQGAWHFGGSAAMAGSWAAVGSPNDTADSVTGSAEVFRIDGPMPSEVSAPLVGLPLLARLVAAGVELSFEDLGALVQAYHVLEGDIPDFSSHVATDCGALGMAAAPRRVLDVPLVAGSKYYMVLAVGGCVAGPLGSDSNGIALLSPDLGCP